MARYEHADAESFVRVLAAIDATAEPEVLAHGESGLTVRADNGSWLSVEGSSNGGPVTGAVWGYDAEGKRADGHAGRNFFPEGDGRQEADTG